MQKAKKSIGKMAMIPSCSIGVIAGTISALSFIAIGALCIQNEYIAFENSRIIAVLVQFVSVILACITAGSVTADKQIMCCAAAGGISFLTFIGAAMLFFEGIAGAVLPGALSAVLGIGASVFVVTRSKNRSVRKRNKKRSR